MQASLGKIIRHRNIRYNAHEIYQGKNIRWLVDLRLPWFIVFKKKMVERYKIKNVEYVTQP